MNKILIEMIKNELKNQIESGMLNPQQQLLAINEALKWLSTLNNEKINETIQKYLDEQIKQQDTLLKTQNKIFENAKNIYNHITTEL